MYVKLDLLFAEHARLLRRGGRYVVITGCYNDTYGQASREVSLINAHYICDIHPRSAYFRAMARHRLVPVHVEDLTAATIRTGSCASRPSTWSPGSRTPS